MNEVWDITIYDGHKEIGHRVLGTKLSISDVIHYMIWLTYTKKEWNFAQDVIEGDGVTIDFVGENKEVCIYCTNILPDIIIKKETPCVILALFPHNMTTHIKQSEQLVVAKSEG